MSIDWMQVSRELTEAAKKMQDTIETYGRAMRDSSERLMRERPDYYEVVSQARYRAKIARERAMGQAFVQAEADRVRRELGLLR